MIESVDVDADTADFLWEHRGMGDPTGKRGVSFDQILPLSAAPAKTYEKFGGKGHRIREVRETRRIMQDAQEAFDQGPGKTA